MTLSKPDHLGPEYGAQFSDASVVAAYHLRPPYPAETFEVLAGLIVDRPRVVLDVGTGTGDIARQLLPYVDRIDAVDSSAAMIDKGRTLPGGASDTITWICEPAETAPLTPPYALVTAGQSLHWMEWSVVLPRLRDALTSSGVLAIVNTREVEVPWQAPLQAIIDRYSTNRLYRPYDLIDELESRGLFWTRGCHETEAASYSQPLADYVASFHARNGFSLDRMTAEAAAAFDRAVAALVAPYLLDGNVTLRISGEIVWGLPAPT